LPYLFKYKAEKLSKNNSNCYFKQHRVSIPILVECMKNRYLKACDIVFRDFKYSKMNSLVNEDERDEKIFI